MQQVSADLQGLSAAGGAPSGLAFLSLSRQAFVPDETTQQSQVKVKE